MNVRHVMKLQFDTMPAETQSLRSALSVQREVKGGRGGVRLTGTPVRMFSLIKLET